MVNKKIKSNRFKPEARQYDPDRSEPGFGIDLCLKCIMTVVVISLVSLASIFAYDFITQSNFFSVQTIQISGSHRAVDKDLLKLGNIQTGMNLFELNLYAIEKKIITHPWILSVEVKRKLPSKLIIQVVEQQPLAIVKIENLADIIINTQGRPFKEYNPLTDEISDLPVISGLDLTSQNNQYLFNGPLFNSIMDFLDIREPGRIMQIKADANTGLMIETTDVYNLPIENMSENVGENMDKNNKVTEETTLQIKLGFNNFKAKLDRAHKISRYMGKHFPYRRICAMDLSNIEKIFVKTKLNNGDEPNTLEKGV